MMREVSICREVVSDASYFGRVALRNIRAQEQVVLSEVVRHTLEPSGVGNVWRSTTVIEVYVNSGFLQSAHAVERPKAPLPTIITDLGTLGADDEDPGGDIAQEETQKHTRAAMRKYEVYGRVSPAKSTLQSPAAVFTKWTNFYSDVVAGRVGKVRMTASASWCGAVQARTAKGRPENLDMFNVEPYLHS